DSRASSWARWSVMDGSFRWLLGTDPLLTLSTVFRPSSREFAPKPARFLRKADRLGRRASRSGRGQRQASPIAPGTGFASPTLSHGARFGPRSAGLPPPTKRDLRMRRPRAVKEPRSRFGAVTPG